ncbi:MAG TPA: exo-alpha-sialidase [Candidatus Latescibacteria bacterium]|nr:exo-alpha-sialidase [Candidatus Latescibacterota bacterium]
MRKLKDIVVFRNERLYASFPTVARTREGELLVGFRVGPREKLPTHFHSQSRAVCVRSSDDGETWSREFSAISPEDELGQQDPSLRALSDGRVLASYFRWQFHPLPERDGLKKTRVLREAKGGLMRLAGVAVCTSDDGGRTWSQFRRVHIPEYDDVAAVRGRTEELPDGTLLMPVYLVGGENYVHILRSVDRGETWEDFSVVVARPPGRENACDEPTLLRLPSGRLLCFIRAYGEGGLMQVTESLDGGRTWEAPRETRVWGFPQWAISLRDGRVFIAYGYRKEPYGVRARIWDPEQEEVDEAEELVLRDDGVSPDLGYPSASVE